MEPVPPPREVGGRKLPHTVGSPRYDNDPYRGQRRRPWMAFRIGSSSLSFQRNVFITFVGRLHEATIEAGILLDSESDVLSISCIEDNYSTLTEEIREALAKIHGKYELGPLSVPVVFLILDSCDEDEVGNACRDFTDSCWFFKIEREEILDMVDDMEYERLDHICKEFAEHVSQIENLVESIAEKIPLEEKVNTFGIQLASPADDRLLDDAQALNQQLLRLEKKDQMNQRHRNARSHIHQQRRLNQHLPIAPHHRRRSDQVPHDIDVLDYQREIFDDELPPLNFMGDRSAPPGLSHPDNHQHEQPHRYEEDPEPRHRQQGRREEHRQNPEYGAPPGLANGSSGMRENGYQQQQQPQRYEDQEPPQRHQEQRFEEHRQNQDYNAPPGLDYASPPGIPLQRPPGLDAGPHYDPVQRPPSELSQFSEDDDYHPSTSSSRRRPDEGEVNGPHILSYDELMSAKSHVPHDRSPHRGIPTKEKHYSDISKHLINPKVFERFEHPYIGLGHNVDLLQVINYAISTRDKSSQPYSKKIIKELFGRCYEQQLTERWLAEPFVNGNWNAQNTTLIFEIMMLFFSTARFQNGFMLTVENFNDAWAQFAEYLENTSPAALARSGVSDIESQSLQNLTSHIDRWIKTAKENAQHGRTPNETDSMDHRQGGGPTHASNDASFQNSTVDNSVSYQRRHDENYERAQREQEEQRREQEEQRRHEEELRMREEEQHRRMRSVKSETRSPGAFRFGRQPPEDNSYEGVESRTPQFNFDEFRDPLRPLRQNHEELPTSTPSTSGFRRDFDPEVRISDEEFYAAQRIRLQKQQEQMPPQELGFQQVDGADNSYPTLDLTTSTDCSPSASMSGAPDFGEEEKNQREAEERERHLPTTNCDEKPKQPYNYNVQGEDGEYQPPWMKCEKMEPPEDFRELTTVPTLRDYVNPVEPFLRRIVELGTYESAHHYLDVQFRLMREDLVSPMRDGIDIYRKNGTCKGRRIDGEPCSDITLYNIERVEGKQVTEREGLEMRIIKPMSYDVGRLLENDREMKEMGLVILSCDRFVDDFHLGHIQQSLLNTQQILHLAVHQSSAPFQANKSYQMAEATSYLPSYKFVLQNIKNISPFKPIPFERYIVHGRKDIYRPNFQRYEKSEQQKAEETRLEKIYNEVRSRAAGRRLMAGKPIPHGMDDDDDDYMLMSKQKVLDEVDLEYEQLQEPIFRPHIGVETKDSDKILIDRRWYKISRLLDDYHPTNMDESQRIAFCNTFKHELSLIQGPPGTGKTHIGVQIVKTMLHNRGHWKIAAPILVVCYTNSGLDNLLERIHQMIDDDEELSRDTGKPKMIRYGMKCESEYLKRLRVMRWDVHEAYRNQVSDRAQTEQSKSGANKRKKADKLATSSYTLYCSRNHILSFKVLKAVMKLSFQEELERFSMEHVDTKEDPLDFDEALGCWLLDKDFGRATRTQTKNAKKNRFEGAAEDSDDEDKQFLTVENDDDEEENDEGLDDEQMLDKIFNKLNLECSGKEVIDNMKGCNLDEYYTRDHWVITGEYLPNDVPIMGVKKKNRSEPIDENINKMVQDIKPMILATSPVAYHELDDIKFIFSLARPKRWALYMHWCAEVRKLVGQRLPEEIRQYRVACEKHAKSMERFDAEIMKMPMVIGCTTTGASRLRPILERIEPRILIVEEAAEVLEAHILSAMISSIEHCVMIGDHKQLRPNPAVHELGVEYGMQISMFERLVERALPYSQLREQHRMNQVISDTIVKPAFYENVIDAENIFHYPDVSGMATNLFMWSHSYKEESPDGISWMNPHEVSMTVALVKHLLKQNYKNKDIVVLTTYAAQRNLMTRENPSLFAGPQQYDQGLIPVHTVDSYQGREGKLVIVSLVRSHRGHRENTGVGFLAVANRICVALTRAQHGMYVVGNAAYLTHNARLWNRIVNDQLDPKALVRYEIPLKCVAHGNVSEVREPSDFPSLSPEGGCLETCNIEKPCGHICHRRCHPNIEEEHDRRCEYPCEKTCANKEYRHKCSKNCYEECGQCMQLVEVVMECGHLVTTPCWRVGIVKCDQPCKLQISCGHPCSAKCGEPCIDISKCTQITMCRLDCGHPKPMVCGVLNTQGMDENCDRRCDNMMLTCKHQCAELCGRPCTLECQEIVRMKLPCGHEQEVKCCEYEPTKLDQIRCKTLVPKKIRPCGHMEPTECGQEPTADQCTRPCPKLLKECNHLCGNLCGRCFIDQVHKCQQRCQVDLDCGHACSAKCSEQCPPCKAFCRNTCEHQSCGTGERDFGRECSALCVMCTQQCSNKCPHRSCTMKCFEECNVKVCNEPCTEKLKACGHACLGLCGERCPTICGTCKRAEYTKAVAGASTSSQRVHRLIQIPKCFHIVSVEQLDEHVRNLRERGAQPRCCMANCNSLLTGVNRYAKYNKKFYLDENLKKLKHRIGSTHTTTLISSINASAQAAFEELTMVQVNMTNDYNKAIVHLKKNILEIRNVAEQLKRESEEKWKLAFLSDVERCLYSVARLVAISSKQRVQKRKDIPPNVDNLFGKCLQETPFGRTMEELQRLNDHMTENYKTWMVGALMPKLRLMIGRMTLYQMISAMSYQLCCDKRDISDADARIISQSIFAVVRCEEQTSFVPKLDDVEAMILRLAPRLKGAKRDLVTWKDLPIPDF